MRVSGRISVATNGSPTQPRPSEASGTSKFFGASEKLKSATTRQVSNGRVTARFHTGSIADAA